MQLQLRRHMLGRVNHLLPQVVDILQVREDTVDGRWGFTALEQQSIIHDPA